MHCRVKTLCGLVGFFVFFSNQNLTRADELNWTKLNTTLVQIQPDSSAQGEVISSYPLFFQQMITGLWSWDPREELKNSPSLPLEKHPSGEFSEVFQNFAIQFDVSDRDHFRKVWFQLSPTLKVRGLMGVHDWKKARRFIILRMGIHGNVDEFLAERFIAKALYEDLDANVLVLESLTSHAFLTNNKEVSFGGIDEGLQTFVILNELTHSQNPFKELVTESHLVALSLGGHGAFVTSILDQQNSHQLSSVLDMCPLINLQKTFEKQVENSGFKAAFIDLWNVKRLESLFGLYPEDISKSEWWKTIFDFKPRFTLKMLEILNRDRKKPLLSAQQIEKNVSGMQWPKGFLDHLEKSKSFYELNDFWDFYRNIKIPTTIYITPNDPLVMTELNSELILSKQQKGDFQNVQIKKFERGIHCGFSSIYRWDYVVQLIKEGLQIQ